MNSNSKGGAIAEAGVTTDHRGFEEDWAQPDAVHWVADGALAGGRIQPKPQAPFPAGFQHLTDFAIGSIPDATGVNMEMLGLRDANQAGVLEHQRKQSALTILAKLFDGLRGYRKRQGRVLLHYITEYLSDGRLVRIVGEEGQKYVPLLRDPNISRYDVIVDDAPTSPNQKEQTWAFVQQILPAVARFISRDDMLAILKYSPFPESFVEEMRKKAEQPDPAQQQMQQLEMAKAQAEVEEDQAGAALDRAKAAQIAAEAQTAPLRAQADMIAANAQATKAQADARAAMAQAEDAPRRVGLETVKTLADVRRGEMQGLAALMRPMGGPSDRAS
jgi:hypothetical protein